MLQQVVEFTQTLSKAKVMPQDHQMELSADSEKQCLLEPQRRSSSEETDSDSSDVATSVGALSRPELLCQQTGKVADVEKEARSSAGRKLFIAASLSFIFMTGELIGGYAAHSLAIMTDAAHLLTDFGSILISLFSLWISSKPHTHNMTFGWHRAEILGMFLSIVSIWAVTAVLVVSAVQRIANGDYDIDGQIMLITSGCAVGVNVLMVLILHQSGAPHGHSHSAPSPRLQTDPHDHGNASVKAAFIHVVGDLLQSLGVLLAATIIHFWPEFKVADPICTFLFSVLVLGTTLPVTKDVCRVLMEGSPPDVKAGAVRDLLLSVGGVVSVHSLHTWSLNMNQYLLSVHVATEEDADAQAVLTKATKLLHSEFSFSSITIQVEQ